MSEALALAGLAATLGAAVVRVRWAPDWAVAVAAAAVVTAAGAISPAQARVAVDRLGPTVGFLAALLVLADGCRRHGLFDALGAQMARASHGRPRRLLAAVFVAAAAITAVLSLDATVALLTPIVFATASRAGVSPRPPVYACTHLANSASLLLPVSNLTNLLAFAACGISFTRFAGLMVLPWLVVLIVEWLVVSRTFRGELRPAGGGRGDGAGRARAEPEPSLPWLPLVVVGLTLAGFALSSTVGIAPVWSAAAGALVLVSVAARPKPSEPRDPESGRPRDLESGRPRDLESARPRDLESARPRDLESARPRTSDLVAAAEPGFLAFVLALGIVVAAAGDHGLAAVVRSLVPGGHGLLALLAVAAISAALANLVNNLPATLIIVPVVAAAGPVSVLAMLIGVGVGPNLTYTGSLATLLWRRVVHAHDDEVDLLQFLRLGALSVPPSLALGTLALWFSARVI